MKLKPGEIANILFIIQKNPLLELNILLHIVETNKLLLGLKTHTLLNTSSKKSPDPSIFMLSPETMTILCGIFIVCVQRLKKQGNLLEKYIFMYILIA